MYQLHKNDSFFGAAKSIRRLSDGALIPFDPANTDYQKYLQWLSDGGVPLPADEVTE